MERWITSQTNDLVTKPINRSLNKNIPLLVILIAFFAFGCTTGSQTTLYDKSLVGSYNELNFYSTSLRGYKSAEGVVYFIEKDMRTLSAYEENRILWRVDIIATLKEESCVGMPVILAINVGAQKIDITYCKHSYAEVDKKSGEVKFWGAD